MSVLNFIGLTISFIGSVLLSAGLIKSKEEAVDEETPFWGANPFKMKSVLSTRVLGLWGLGLITAGFAMSAVASLTDILGVKDIRLGIIGSLLLTMLGWMAIALVVRAKQRAHLRAKHAHFHKALVNRIESLIQEYGQNLIPKAKSYDFASIRDQHYKVLSGYESDLNQDDKQVLKGLTSKIKVVRTFKSIHLALSKSLEDLKRK